MLVILDVSTGYRVVDVVDGDVIDGYREAVQRCREIEEKTGHEVVVLDGVSGKLVADSVGPYAYAEEFGARWIDLYEIVFDARRRLAEKRRMAIGNAKIGLNQIEADRLDLGWSWLEWETAGTEKITLEGHYEVDVEIRKPGLWNECPGQWPGDMCQVGTGRPCLFCGYTHGGRHEHRT